MITVLTMRDVVPRKRFFKIFLENPTFKTFLETPFTFNDYQKQMNIIWTLSQQLSIFNRWKKIVLTLSRMITPHYYMVENLKLLMTSLSMKKKVFNTLKAYRIGQHLHYGTSKFSLIRNIFRWTFFQWSWYFESTPQEHNDVIIMCLLMSYLVESDI